MKQTADPHYQLVILWLMMMSLPFFVSGQPKNFITGIVLTGEKEAPVPNASVFITNSSRGTVTSATGHFELKDIPDGKYELVISSVGFATQVFPFSSDKLPLKLRVY
ncbi:MAG: carboxypeptidase-like regulatory domain-containing protein, partial [Chitinophagaceae bacterium]